MNAAIITIGDEILIGQIVDTNSAWLAENLNLLGIKVDEIISVSDNSDHIKESLQRYIGKKDIVLISGGLGPTKDDITKTTLAEFFESKLIFRPEVLAHIEKIFAWRNVKISEVNRLQAYLPDNCKVLKNPSGTASGMWFEKSGTIVVSLPGVPYELKDIYETSLLPELTSLLKGPVIVHRTVMTQGIPESVLSERIKDWEESLPKTIKLAYLPRPGIVRLRLTGIGEDKYLLEDILESQIAKLLKIIGKDVFSLKDIPIEKVIAELLLEKKILLATAESCTGGAIAKLITSVPGSSQYFRGSIIAYDNSVKNSLLKVKEESLILYGAVSKQVVEEMAEGARTQLGTDYAIATSGIAGPGGGTKEKPVGSTWIAVSGPKNTISKHFHFGEHRGRNVEKASIAALNMLRNIILEINTGE